MPSRPPAPVVWAFAIGLGGVVLGTLPGTAWPQTLAILLAAGCLAALVCGDRSGLLVAWLGGTAWMAVITVPYVSDPEYGVEVVTLITAIGAALIGLAYGWCFVIVLVGRRWRRHARPG